MNSFRNQVQLIGNVGKNPEMRTASNGNKYATFSLATTDSYKNKEGERKVETTWHNIVLWDTQAEIAEKYITKGSLIGVQAKLIQRQYADKDGSTRTQYDLRVSDITLLGSRQASASNSNEAQPASAIADEGLPF